MRLLTVGRLGVSAAVLLLTVGFSLTTWKMFEFHRRLADIIDNGHWQGMLRENLVAADDLIVFFGDSEMALWSLAPSFGTLPIVNKGVCGDLAADAVARFDHDVLDLGPRTVVILIVTNDLGHRREPERIVEDIESMVRKARGAGVRTIVCSLLPVRDVYVRNHSPETNVTINGALRTMAASCGAEYVDLHERLVDGQGLLDPRYTRDGLHPTLAGYVRMSEALRPALLREERPARVPEALVP